MKKITETHNINSIDIDTKNIHEIISIISNDNNCIVNAVNSSAEIIEEIIYTIIQTINNGGKLIYVGAGTSGRLGVLDAAECRPTFGVDSNLIQGIIAGGREALVNSIEGAEDNIDDIENIIKRKKINKNDFIFGISCSGNALFVLDFLKKTKKIGAGTALLTFNDINNINYIDIILKVFVGPEIITGSTRMKSGTATKIILNMISTISMIKLNKTYGNYMIDLKIVNNKLYNRGINIIKDLTGVSVDEAKDILKNAKGNVKNAIAMHQLKINYSESVVLLSNHNGSLREVLNQAGIN